EKKRLVADPATREELRLQCIRDTTAGVRTLFLAASKATRAAGHCGGTETLCGRSVARGAAALSGVAEVGAFLRSFCHGPTDCCQWNPDAKKVECKCGLKDVLILKIRDVSDQEQCGRFSGSMIKLLGSAAESFGEAGGQCKSTKANARDSCAALVPSAVTGLGFLIENMARTSRECTRPRSKYLFPNDIRQ
ncbi:unnamed protein product, partial [Polarella glacialis]